MSGVVWPHAWQRQAWQGVMRTRRRLPGGRCRACVRARRMLARAAGGAPSLAAELSLVDCSEASPASLVHGVGQQRRVQRRRSREENKPAFPK